jgi:hypothetical protein
MSEDPDIKAEPEQMMSLLNAASSLTIPRTNHQPEAVDVALERGKEGDQADDVPMMFPQKVSSWIVR